MGMVTPWCPMALYGDLTEYFNNPAFSDVRLYTKERKLHVNSIVLCQHSSVFKKLLEDDSERDIFLHSFLEEEDEMEMVLSSLYRQSLLLINNDVLFVVTKFSLTYQIHWMTLKCEKYVVDNLSHDTCVQFCRIGHKMRDYFQYSLILTHCCDYISSTSALEEIVMVLEMEHDEEEFTSLPYTLLEALLCNKFRRDERRIVNLLTRWFKRDQNVILAMELIKHLLLSQLYLTNKDLHAELFTFLISSERLTSEDRKIILALSSHSIEDSKHCIISSIGFSKVVTQDTSTHHILHFLSNNTWTACSFDDVIMVKQYVGVTVHLYLELFLTWSRHNHTTDYQLDTILASVALDQVNPEFLQDVLDQIKRPGHNPYRDNVGEDLGRRVVAHNYTANPGSVRQFTRHALNQGNLQALVSKKHTLTVRPCTVAGCRERSLGCVDIKLKRDVLPWFKLGKLNTYPSMLDHCHNSSVHHVYFLVNDEIVSCFSETWDYVAERLKPVYNVTVVVVCKGT